MLPEISKTAVGKIAENTTIPPQSKPPFERLVPVPAVEIGPLKVSALVENIPLVEEHARFFSAPEFRELSISDLPDINGVRIELNDQAFDIPVEEGTVLDQIGARDLLAYAMDPAVEQFTQVRLEELRAAHEPKVEELFRLEFPSSFVICCPMPQWPRFFGALENAAFNVLPEDMNLTAKRIDYLVGDQYVSGRMVDLPILGGVSNLVFKNNLGETIERADWANAVGDVMVIAPIALAPFVPLTGGAAIAAWVAANAAFGAMSSGLTEYAASGDQGNALEQAGKGALIGAVGGLAGGVAVSKLMPAISNPLLAHTAAGSATGAAYSTTEATIRVIENGENLEEAAKDIIFSAFEGAAVGGGTGALGFGATKLAGKMTASPALTSVVNEGIEKGSVKDLLERARLAPYCQGKTPGFFKRLEGHVQELGDIPGVRENLSIMSGKNLNAAKGRFTELGAAAAFKKAGHEVVAVGKIVTVPGLGKTDIDLLTGSGKWIEKKHVRQIACDTSFRTKIDKMAGALEQGLEVGLGEGKSIRITESIFVNSGKISPEAIRYAEGKGVKIFQKTPYTRVPL